MNAKAQQHFQPFAVFRLPFNSEDILKEALRVSTSLQVEGYWMLHASAKMVLLRLRKMGNGYTIQTYPDILADTPPRNRQILF